MAADLVPADQQSETMLAPRFSPRQMLEGLELAKKFVRDSLKENVHYGVIPGTDKKTLWIAGADDIEFAYGLTTTFEIIEKEVDHCRENTYDAGKWVTIDDPGYEESARLKEAFPDKYRSKKYLKKGAQKESWLFQQRYPEVGTSIGLYRYVVKARVCNHLGVQIGEAIGICSSMESRYIRSPRDAEHTIYSMAAKRAKIAAISAALRLRRVFDSVEGEDLPDDGIPEPSQEERRGATDTTAHPVQIRGMAVVLRDWGISPETKKELDVICLDNDLKLADAISKAQTVVGPSAIETPEAFRAWLNGLKEAQS